MTAVFDVIIIGSGPAGVSAAFPLLEAGMKVLMLDVGETMQVQAPETPFLEWREHAAEQWKWMIGETFHALANCDAVSPKLRVPTHAYVFKDFESANKIQAHEFMAVGSLAQGGLSNAWGCGVARLSETEMADFPFATSDIDPSYERVARRMGISGACNDDMSDFFRLDDWADSPIALGPLHQHLLDRYAKGSKHSSLSGIRMGRARVAALSLPKGERQACDLSGNCLWGCRRHALYSASEDVTALLAFDNFHYQSGHVVNRVRKTGSILSVETASHAGSSSFTAQRVVLAAGTLATTRLALEALNYRKPVAMQSCPTAAFMLWLPRCLGTARVKEFGLGQLSFSMELPGQVTAFGSLFGATGIPMAEISRFLPLKKRFGIDFLKGFMSSCLVGNVFLPGTLSTGRLTLTNDDALSVYGGHQDAVPGLMHEGETRLGVFFRKLGAIMLPRSFTISKPGSCIHYTSTLPMRAEPGAGETHATGELAGMDGVYVVDGACLPSLSAKSHTMTIMANADRVGCEIARRVHSTTDKK